MIINTLPIRTMTSKNFLTILILTSALSKSFGFEENIDILTKNFFSNLQEDPHIRGIDLTESSKQFIDRLVDSYLDLMKYGGAKHMVTRRSLPINDIDTLTQDNSGTHILSSYAALFNIRAIYPRDMVMFYHDYDGYKQWYAVVLDGQKDKMANRMSIYKLQQMKFEKILEITVENGNKLAVGSEGQNTLIIIAHYNLDQKTDVFQFNNKEELKIIQTLKIQYASDVKIWQDNQHMFLTFAQHMVNNSDHIIYEVNMPVYRWLGKHFDLFDEVKTQGAQCIEHFSVGKYHFLAVANYKNDYGKTNIYSEIFKLDIDSGKFVSHQRILTNAATNVKHFYLKADNVQEHFLIYANLFEMDEDGSQNYETDSIIYKYVEGFFMPFQGFKISGAMQWLPIMGDNNEFVLLVASKFDGVKAFQYNGWKFIESAIQYTTGAFSKGVVAMHSYSFNNSIILTITNENDDGSMKNVFQVTFTHQNKLNQLQENLLSWCRATSDIVEDVEHKSQVKSANDNDEPVLQVAQSHASNATAAAFQIDEPDEEHSEDLLEIQNVIRNQSDQLNMLENQFRNALKKDSTNIIKDDVNVKKLILNDFSFFNTINATTINGIPVSDIIYNVININEEFIINNNIQMEDIYIENDFLPKFMNNYDITSLIYKNRNSSIGHLIVNGTVTINKNFKTNGKIDGINFDRNNILLSKGDQSLLNLNVSKLKIDHAHVSNFTYLSTNKLYVNGYVNNVDIETITKFALRKSGSQSITSEYSFEKLHVNKLVANAVSSKIIPDDLVLTNMGEYEIEHPIVFTADFEANNLFVAERLNGIPVVNGTLQVLLADVPHMQHIKGIKTFENLQLQNPINLQGKINSSKFDKINPVLTIDEEKVYYGDYIITGNVTIEQIIQTNDIQSDSHIEAFSIQRLWNKGLKLVEQDIPVHLQFQQQLNVDELFADKINDLNVQSLIVMGSKEPQIITGWKKFPSDVTILGSTKVTNINDINLQELDSNILKTTGNQTLSGKHYFQTLIANRVYNIKTRFGKNLWDDVVTTNTNQHINGTTILTVNTVEANTLKTKTLNTLRINGFDFNALLNDTITKGKPKQILGHTKFVALTVSNLQVETLDLDRIPNIIEEAQTTFQIDSDISLPNNIFIENILFTSHFNNIPYQNFGHQWMLSDAEQVVESDQNFDRLIIYGKLFIESGFINDVNVLDISENSIKIDEPFHFSTITFAKGVASLQGISLEGTFDSLSLNDIVQSNSRVEQTIMGDAIFHNNVVVYGEVNFEGLVSAVNITDLCRFAFPADNYGPYNLEVTGNAYFAKGPVVQHINTVPIKYILDNAWFQNKDVILTGNFQFDSIRFEHELVVHGLIDNINLEDFSENYLSKTKDQNISVPFEFENSVFRKGLYAPTANVLGLVCGFSLEEFMHTAILDGYEQLFENTVYLDTCVIQDLQGVYLVNNLNLETDVMRYNIPNIVTGKKFIENVQTYSMTLEHNVKVQDIDVLWWIQNAVLKKGTFSMSGEMIFQNKTQFLNNTGTQGFVNRQSFNQDTIMLKSLPQTIKGKKKISGNTIFQSVKLKGLLNDFDLLQFLHNQAYKNQNISFKTPIHFNANIGARSVIVEKLYQGVNVTKLIHNITRFATIENYQEHYENLRKVSSQVKNSLFAQAYFVDYYEVKQVYQMVDIIPLKFQNSTASYLACVRSDNKNYSIEYHAWNKEKEQFQPASDVENLHIPLQLHYIQKITFQEKDRWYIENKSKNNSSDSSFESSIYDVTKMGLIQIMPLILHNGTKTVLSLVLPDKNKNCIFLLVLFENSMLYCEENINQEVSLQLYQEFDTNNAIQAITDTIQETVCIFIINKGTIFNEPTVDIWKYDITIGKFNIVQNIYITSPNSINVALHRKTSYLVIASGHLRNVKHAGLLKIYKYNSATAEFEIYQNINVNAPLQVQFAKLPTNELILYVVTDNPAEPLIMFSYEGIAGFKKSVVASTLPKTIAITCFNTDDNHHFVLAKNVNKTRLIEGVFKGYKYL